MRSFSFDSSSQLIMLDLRSAADNNFLKDELLLSWDAANKSPKEVIALIGLAVSASFTSSTFGGAELYLTVKFFFSFLVDRSCHP